jgi:hypothetical protein
MELVLTEHVHDYAWQKNSSFHWMLFLAAAQNVACSGRFGIFHSHNLFIESLQARNSFGRICTGSRKARRRLQKHNISR